MEPLAACLHRSRRDPAAFEELFASEFERVLVLITRRVFDVDMALDLAAETLAQAFLSRRRFRGATDAQARARLFAIARHQLSRYFRRGRAERRALRRLGIEPPAPSAEEASRITELVRTEDLRSAVRDGLADLSADQRRALQLRIVEERPYPEAAALLGVSEQVVRARVSRGLRALSDAVDRAVPQEGAR